MACLTTYISEIAVVLSHFVAMGRGRALGSALCSIVFDARCRITVPALIQKSYHHHGTWSSRALASHMDLKQRMISPKGKWRSSRGALARGAACKSAAGKTWRHSSVLLFLSWSWYSGPGDRWNAKYFSYPANDPAFVWADGIWLEGSARKREDKEG
jgi:hypothetical protein